MFPTRYSITLTRKECLDEQSHSHSKVILTEYGRLEAQPTKIKTAAMVSATTSTTVVPADVCDTVISTNWILIRILCLLLQQLHCLNNIQRIIWLRMKHCSRTWIIKVIMLLMLNLFKHKPFHGTLITRGPIFKSKYLTNNLFQSFRWRRGDRRNNITLWISCGGENYTSPINTCQTFLQIKPVFLLVLYSI